MSALLILVAANVVYFLMVQWIDRRGKITFWSMAGCKWVMEHVPRGGHVNAPKGYIGSNTIKHWRAVAPDWGKH